jgi:hypothetical protein
MLYPIVIRNGNVKAAVILPGQKSERIIVSVLTGKIVAGKICYANIQEWWKTIRVS